MAKSKTKIPPGLKAFAEKWRKSRSRKAAIDSAVLHGDEFEIESHAWECAEAFAKTQARATHKAASKRLAKSAAADPCAPIRVALAAQQSISADLAAQLYASDLAVMILVMWLAMCEMGA